MQGPGGSFTISPVDAAAAGAGPRGGEAVGVRGPTGAPQAGSAVAQALQPLSSFNSGSEDPPKIKVVVRKRPISRKVRAAASWALVRPKGPLTASY
jgi:hypothetical protein